ncbi:uncharacterized protein FOMMEDRAFT_131416 [Fomitiporia mediterranea MF3/22]|uniref:uncharacterized protein n=1 Tax=Fomitiporia mediterranea (strain MF3/22) TaxID=694068 RepID=UPI0004409457|nr:uncharacterized protein FOMMEDRAFT_131416 [Fomitiporia mediterranea MF3/22]EJD06477.1 hypothetical protein FOMMEDRAFT_131416 [Fomitiporia mediterranea MF3/22]
MREFNAVVLGAGGVGKSALTCRFIRDVFVDTYDPTIEEEYSREFNVDGEWTKLEVLDTAGAEQFTAFNEMYIKSGMAFILVFSLTQRTTLREVDHLRQQIYRIKGANSNVPIVVVGTKSDLTAERDVDRELIAATAERWGLPFYETSAKRNWHVNDVFEDLIRQMRERYPVHPRRKRERCIIM